ncbi:hypothetical protein PR048_010112 [Dryococelus australis]|uniref:Uncharacterized protein n=1 Tax=Dryococelus australis TaxID=614101 RepID=A0ABQ9I3Q7_9NEOP|nr:hypothetical protein PR048_010112 [Dryococelus australis]
MLQHLTEDDPDRRAEFYERALNMYRNGLNFVSSVLFSDEANSYVNGEGRSTAESEVLVFFGPFFIAEIMNADVYLDYVAKPNIHVNPEREWGRPGFPTRWGIIALRCQSAQMAGPPVPFPLDRPTWSTGIATQVIKPHYH